MTMLDTFTGAELQAYGEMLHRGLCRLFDAATDIFTQLPAMRPGAEYDRLWRQAAALADAAREQAEAHDEVIQERRDRRAGVKPGEHYAGQHALERTLAASGR